MSDRFDATAADARPETPPTRVIDIDWSARSRFANRIVAVAILATLIPIGALLIFFPDGTIATGWNAVSLLVAGVIVVTIARFAIPVLLRRLRRRRCPRLREYVASRQSRRLSAVEELPSLLRDFPFRELATIQRFLRREFHSGERGVVYRIAPAALRPELWPVEAAFEPIFVAASDRGSDGPHMTGLTRDPFTDAPLRAAPWPWSQLAAFAIVFGMVQYSCWSHWPFPWSPWPALSGMDWMQIVAVFAVLFLSLAALLRLRAFRRTLPDPGRRKFSPRSARPWLRSIGIDDFVTNEWWIVPGGILLIGQRLSGGKDKLLRVVAAADALLVAFNENGRPTNWRIALIDHDGFVTDNEFSDVHTSAILRAWLYPTRPLPADRFTDWLTAANA